MIKDYYSVCSNCLKPTGHSNQLMATKNCDYCGKVLASHRVGEYCYHQMTHHIDISKEHCEILNLYQKQLRDQKQIEMLKQVIELYETRVCTTIDYIRESKDPDVGLILEGLSHGLKRGEMIKDVFTKGIMR